VPDPANPKVEATVGSLFGLAQVAQGGIIADHERTMAAFEKAALAPGQHGGWFCPMCGTAYPDDYEPDFCPPCDSRLLRLRAPTEEERVAWLRAHGHQP
jgi:hypothetical protein